MTNPGYLAVLSLPLILTALVAGQTPPRSRLCPTPQEVAWPRGTPITLDEGQVTIVIGERAEEPERYAAEKLHADVAKRFGHSWPIVATEKDRPTTGVVIALGCRPTCSLVDRLCTEGRIELSERSPGHDGYVIQVMPGDGPAGTAAGASQAVVLVGGSNARGVIYGQDTLFQLLTPRDGKVTLPRVAVRDWPSIPWRGRPQTQVSHYLRPGEMDLLATSRINFIDLREGIYAFDPGSELNADQIRRVIREARRRGMVVFGTVNVGVPAAKYDDAIKTFGELIELGADGLWLSFDDQGPGERPEEITRRVLDLGREHGITGQRIAICPPKGSYQLLDDGSNDHFNRKIIGVAGMETALWFWTFLPLPQEAAAARAMGLRVRPSWWHNWPRLPSNHAYIEVPSLALGWHAPSYEVLADANDACEAAMIWGGNSYPQYYIAPIQGWWSWNPKAHNWQSTRTRVYELVYGPDMIAHAIAFDDALRTVRHFFKYAVKQDTDMPAYPPRIADPQQREAAFPMLTHMDALLLDIEASAPVQTMLDPTELKAAYLDSMRRELDVHSAASRLDFPEYWWDTHQRRVLEALHAGNPARADELITAARGRLSGELAAIDKTLGEYCDVKSYVAWWQQRGQLDAAGWQQLIQARQAALAARVEEYDRMVVPAAKMLAQSKTPPTDWGTGRWQVGNRLLATVLPRDHEVAWGDWAAGLFNRADFEAAVFAAKRRTPGDIGEYAELPVDVPVSGDRSRLGLLLFLSNFNKEKIGLSYTETRWAGYRFIQLLWDDRVLWEADLGPQRELGDWFMVPLPIIPNDVATLSLRLRVEDRKVSMNNYTIAYVGPIHLVELPPEVDAASK